MSTTVRVAQTQKVTVKPDVTENVVVTIKAIGPQGPSGTVAGAMSPDVYDPTNIASDAFDMDNMVEGVNLIFSAAERSKLGGIQALAQVNPTAAETKTLYESNLNTNVFTDAEKTKLGNQSGTNTGDQVSSDFNHNALSGLVGVPGEYNHPTNAQMITIANTSGVNTGDQSSSDFNHDSLSGLTGTIGQYNHPTDAQMTVLENTSGVNTGDQTVPTALSELTDDSLHRTVTDTEKSTWNSKQNALVADTDYLTPATASTTYAPALGADDNYVTDAEKIVIGNTSGTNTGDQNAASVAITDSGNHFTSTNVEGALQEAAVAAENEVASTGTDYTTHRIRNVKFMTTVPVDTDFTGNGDIIFVYEA